MDVVGPGQAWAIAAIDLCDLINGRSNKVTIRWVPAHNRVEGNEVADGLAMAAAGRPAPFNDADIPDDPSGRGLHLLQDEKRRSGQDGGVDLQLPRRPPVKAPSGSAGICVALESIGRLFLLVPVRPASGWIVSSRQDSQD